ncbi:MAG: NAD-dependent protein deacetylase [Lautropia sp.]
MSDALAAFVDRHPRLFVLTGAGVSTDSGIPDYRDERGAWKRAQPMTWQAFTGSVAARQRYWGRSMIGWPRIAAALPNDAHRALARLEDAQRLRLLVTQNVDGLHQRAGSRSVVDLHGRLDRVVCLTCRRLEPRLAFQHRLQALNPQWQAASIATAPDGDAELDGVDYARFVLPACEACGGILKPDVVFFGESVPRDRVETARAALAGSDAMLIVGSSLMVFSGFRFAREAAQLGKPIASVSLGVGRADDLLSLKVCKPVAEALRPLLADDSPVRGARTHPAAGWPAPSGAATTPDAATVSAAPR